ncbi:MAG: helix-turn-helix domain-containing protein, partial [Nitrososphaerota archaeon]
AYIYYFLLKECRKQRKEQEISKSAMDFLRSLKWEGNLRELRSTIHFLVLMKDEGVIEKEDVLKAMEEGGSFQSNLSSLAKLEEDKFQGLFKKKGLRDLLLEFERELILKALEESGWNVDSAAKLLKISKRTLYYKMRRYKIE